MERPEISSFLYTASKIPDLDELFHQPDNERSEKPSVLEESLMVFLYNFDNEA